MSEPLVIHSHEGLYKVLFDNDALEHLDGASPNNAHFIVDARVAELYAPRMERILKQRSVLLIEATEEAKSLDRFPGYVAHLVGRHIRRDHMLIAIGGGIIQDITCFLAATLLRGLPWRFYPTTLLAQADSCIGSKSSINCGNIKNILGTFTPPQEISISARFLDTLDPRDVRSGIGEMLKVHAIDGPDSFNQIAADYERLFADKAVMVHYIRRALEIKKRYIEEDEFDRGPRNVFNYGHSFGHAIESATEFAIPHGIAVTIGMDMANYAAARMGLAPEEHFQKMHPVLKTNFRGFGAISIPVDRFMAALAKDKKNLGADQVTLVLPGPDSRVVKGAYLADAVFRSICTEYLEQARVS